jgi:uncharacterized phage infection (PIP) family protein YhgE
MTTSLRSRIATGLVAFACLVALTFAIQTTAAGSHAATAVTTVDQSSLNVPATAPQSGSSGDGSGSNGDGSASSGDGSGSFGDGSGSSSDGSGSFDDGSGSFDDGSGSLDDGSGSAPSVDPGSGTPRSGTS